MNDQDASHRSHLVEGRRKAQEDYDKTLVLLAGGALALSLAFLHQIVADKPAHDLCALACGWGLLVGSLVSTLASYSVSRVALIEAIRRFDRGDRSAGLDIWTIGTEMLNVLAGLLFVAGTSCVLYFAFHNLGAHK
jgi:hypothetical protein